MGAVGRSQDDDIGL
jgi:hypothetical protein